MHCVKTQISRQLTIYIYRREDDDEFQNAFELFVCNKKYITKRKANVRSSSMAADETVAAISTEATIRIQIILDEDVGDMLLWMQNIQSDVTVLLLVTIRNYVLYVICTN